MRHCFGRYRDTQKGIHFERVRSGSVRSGYRFAPRIYTPRTIDQIAANIRKQSFVLRYVSEEDRWFAFEKLPRLGEGQPQKFDHYHGSYQPQMSVFFDLGATLRALMKLGLNLIAAFCTRTPVTYDSFFHSIQVIRNEAGQIPPGMLASNGFVRPENVSDLKADNNAHSFRLLHAEGRWHVYSSFFGGQVGTYVSLPGPSRELWRTLDIVAPLRAREWTSTESSILKLVKAQVSWTGGQNLIPSVPIHRSGSSTGIEIKKVRPRR